MNLTLTNDDGEVVDQWNVAAHFGDLRKPMPRALLAAEIAAAVIRAEAQRKPTEAP